MALPVYQAEMERFFEASSQWPDFHNYKDLDVSRREIRLLRLRRIEHSEAGDGKQVGIHVTIEHASIDQNVEYEAISHYWGPPCDLETIYVEGKCVKIRKTLYCLLNALCRIGQARLIWLDVICINQNNNAERSWQVSMMGDIYKYARRVKAWVGNADADTDYALDYVRFQSKDAAFNSNVPQTIRDKLRSSFSFLVSRSYWKRLWIVQEIGLSKDLCVICGDRMVDWVDLYNAVSTLFEVRKPKQNSQSISDTESKETTYNIESIKPLLVLHDLRLSLQNTENSKQEPSSTGNKLDSPSISQTEGEATDRHFSTQKATSVLQRVCQFEGYECQDPRDKVFGLLSIASPNHGIVVSYEKSMCDVLFDMLASAELQVMRDSCIDKNAWMGSTLNDTSADFAKLAREAHFILQDIKVDEIKLLRETNDNDSLFSYTLNPVSLADRVSHIRRRFSSDIHFRAIYSWEQKLAGSNKAYQNYNGSSFRSGYVPSIADFVISIDLKDMALTTNSSPFPSDDKLYLITRPEEEPPRQLMGISVGQFKDVDLWAECLFSLFATGNILFCKSPKLRIGYVQYRLHFNRAAFLAIVAMHRQDIQFMERFTTQLLSQADRATNPICRCKPSRTIEDQMLSFIDHPLRISDRDAYNPERLWNECSAMHMWWLRRHHERVSEGRCFWYRRSRLVDYFAMQRAMYKHRVTNPKLDGLHVMGSVGFKGGDSNSAIQMLAQSLG